MFSLPPSPFFSPSSCLHRHPFILFPPSLPSSSLFFLFETLSFCCMYKSTKQRKAYRLPDLSNHVELLYGSGLYTGPILLFLPPFLSPFLPFSLPPSLPSSLPSSLPPSLPPFLPSSLPPSLPPSFPPSQGSSDISYVVAVGGSLEDIDKDWKWLEDNLVETLGNE